MASSQDMIIEHPNGSEGWLPAEPPLVKQEESDPIVDTSADPHRRSTTKRKKSSTSRHSSQPRESGVVPLVNDNETTPAVNETETSFEDLKNRAVSANNNLTPKQRSRIAKSEAKDGRRISKIIKEEGKTEKQTVDIAIKELEELQKFQKTAVKSEANAHSNHSKSLFAFRKIEAAYLNAKLRHETALAELHAEDDTLETLRNNTKAAAELVQNKTTEIEGLRTTLAVDEREREIRLSDLKGSTINGGTGSRGWRS